MYTHTVYIINIYRGLRGALEYFITELNGVHYQDSQAVRLGSTEHLSSNQGQLIIPHSVQGYVPPHVWNQLEDKTSGWTIQEHDLVVKQGLDLNLETPQKTKGARTVESIENIDYSIAIGNHYEIKLK